MAERGCRAIVQEKVVLSESEYNLLNKLKGKVSVGEAYTIDELEKISGFPRSTLEAILSLLSQKGVVEIRRVRRARVRLTKTGESYLREGFPEEKLVQFLRDKGGSAPIGEVSRRLGSEAPIAIANALRLGIVERRGDVLVLKDRAVGRSPDRELVERLIRGERLSEQEIRVLRRRRIVEVEDTSETIVVFKQDPALVLEKAVVEVGALTVDHIRSGAWRKLRLRRYDVTAKPPRLYPNRLHYMVEFIEFVRDVMAEMGFVEVEYPAIELELWNYDVLFQPQYHPARAPTDTFYVAGGEYFEKPGREIVERVKMIHERGWGYRWDPSKAFRIILRSHTTSTSVRVLYSKPKPPIRYFTIGRVYRVEKVDPKHLPEFHQLDGIAAEDNLSFRDLLGILAEFFERIGIREYKFRLAYFPFTEPSAEGYVRVRGEWIEVLGCGMFRPEVLEAVGIEYPVAAWGMGLERIAMSLYGINDIRQLYTFDANMVKEFRRDWRIYARVKI